MFSSPFWNLLWREWKLPPIHKKLQHFDNSILWSWKGFFVHWTKSAFPQHNHRMIQVGYQPYMMKWLPKAKLPKVCLLTSLGRLNLGAFLDIPLNTSILLLQKRLLNLTYLKVKHDFLNVRLFGTYSTLFENYPKCRIWIISKIVIIVMSDVPNY